MIVDAHAHFGQGLRSTAPYGPLFEAYTADQLLRHLDAAGIDRAVCFPPRWQGGRFIDPDYRKATPPSPRECGRTLTGWWVPSGQSEVRRPGGRRAPTSAGR